ncbi:MAG TPA: HisS family protein, partial [Bacteroidales bacterium]|nr:HisS family protein [Bacteroidales bacterium]
MMTKPSIPKGTRDFGPSDTARRNFIFETIKKVFMLHGFSQIETPAMENLSTLLGKYGDEGDKLLFRILNSGDFLSDVPGDKRDNPDAAGLLPFVSDKGLRYDLTVPFARFVVQHQNEISFPFKRFQIQPVWRADRPQRGRYREFFQCDADVIGSDAIVNEFEMVQLVNEVFAQLGIEVTVHVNNRKILYGIAEVFGYANKFSEITVAIDKLDKTGRDKVKLELTEKGVDEITADRLLDMYCENAETDQLLISLEELFINSETGRKGLSEINELLEYCNSGNLKTKVKPDVSLARGLNYYTGAIFEV